MSIHIGQRQNRPCASASTPVIYHNPGTGRDDSSPANTITPQVLRFPPTFVDLRHIGTT
ncbi:hypothetical protein BD309DRAFT_917942 [Dichomitus squalens]|nr:hypothetical protein BD309DRAFT_917942 [Dichomitus squalens]